MNRKDAVGFPLERVKDPPAANATRLPLEATLFRNVGGVVSLRGAYLHWALALAARTSIIRKPECEKLSAGRAVAGSKSGTTRGSTSRPNTWPRRQRGFMYSNAPNGLATTR